MSLELTLSIVFITLALGFYTTGVWAERLARVLKPWHLWMFWLGLVCDATGTYAMERLEPGIDWTSFHTITGQLAIWLMLGHAIWATWTLRRGTPEAQRSFYRYSIFVWAFWLIPYVGGAYLGMS